MHQTILHRCFNVLKTYIYNLFLCCNRNYEEGATEVKSYFSNLLFLMSYVVKEDSPLNLIYLCKAFPSCYALKRVTEHGILPAHPMP